MGIFSVHSDAYGVCGTNLKIAVLSEMTDVETVNERLLHLLGLEEDRFIARFNQQVHKAREKAWHDRHIKNKSFKVGDLVLLYENKFAKFPGQSSMHWLGPYEVKHVTNAGEVFPTMVNGSRLKLYRDNPLPQ